METVKTKCPTCDKTFLARKHHFDRNRDKAYCCRKCWSNRPKKLYTLECIVCGKTRSFTPKQWGTRKGLFCSQVCVGISKTGPNHPMWKGGIYAKGNTGYLMQYDEATRTHQRQHRFLMEKLLKRKLLDNEVVHHINGKKSDNRIENLCLMMDTKHRSLHMTQRHKERKEHASI